MTIPTNLVALLSAFAEEAPKRDCYAFLEDGENETSRLSAEALFRSARTVAVALQRRNAAGKPVMLVFPPGAPLVVAFWGCLLAGALAAPTPSPDPVYRNEKTLERLRAVISDANPCVALTSPAFAPALRDLLDELDASQDTSVVCVDELDAQDSDAWVVPDVGPDTLAYLQYTSGSTGVPRGVMVSHANVLANCAFNRRVCGFDESSVLVNWIATFNAQGLIYGICGPVFDRFLAVHMPPVAFLENPIRWLRAITKYRATHAGGPNYGYDLCGRIPLESRAGLDLGSWKNAYSAGEPIRYDAIRRFIEAYAPLGFDPSAFQACYGQSEATLRSTAAPIGSGLAARVFDADSLARGDAVPVPPTSAELPGVALVSHGPLDRGAFGEILIVDPGTCMPCTERRVGEIWISGPDVAIGYWNRTPETEATFRARLRDGRGPFLRTGDLGFALERELYVAGRHKDLIIVRGANHYPQDIEFTIESCAPSVRPECSIAFSLEVAGEERVVVVLEVERRSSEDRRKASRGDQPRRGRQVEPGYDPRTRRYVPELIVRAVQDSISQCHGLQVHEIVLVKAGSIPKTASGKKQRSRCRAQYVEGRLEDVFRWKRSYDAPSEKPDPASPVDEGQAARTESWLRAALSARLGVPAAELDGRRPFAEYGLDSAGALTLVGEIARRLGTTLSPAVLFNYPTIDALVAHLAPRPSGRDALPAVESVLGHSAPIAIVGIGCRFPKASGPEAFWQLLSESIDAVTEVPSSRWDVDAVYSREPATPGKTNTRWGGFVEGVDLFDAAFFGMSPDAAAVTDPQQRLLLEVGWEALEDAAIDVGALAGTSTGVFVGITQYDYGRKVLAKREQNSPFAATGASNAVAAARLSYQFDLRGPCLSIDTACSSSLVALHYACQSLRNGESSLALVGGVNLVLTADKTIALSQGTFLSPDGRCKSFDAAANGYVRGEGAAVVVLKPLEHALRDGDRIHAVIRGTAVNQDGRTSGLTAPSGLAQARVIRAALANGGLRPEEIGLVEAHGTGTPLGDPIEAEALGNVLGADGARSRPCALGSVKSNIGHLEAAAGIAGLIKVALCLRERQLVPSLHFDKPNPYIPFERLALRVQTRTEPWHADGPRAAGVSAFGFGGTNAHAVLVEPPQSTTATAPAAEDGATSRVLVLSAADESSLREIAARYVVALEEREGAPKVRLDDVCFTAAVGRRHLVRRLAVLGTSASEMKGRLAAYAADGDSTGVIAAATPAGGTRPRIAFVFPGGGSQYVGMARELYRTEVVFRTALDRCAATATQVLERPLRAVMFGDGADGALLDRMEYMLAALFAIGVALSELWQAWGIVPDVVLGHSLGELTAACVAGVFSIEDGLRLVVARGRLMAECPPGRMFSVMARVEDVAPLIEGRQDQVSIAAHNGPTSVVLSGQSDVLVEIMATLEGRGVTCKWLGVSCAAHSPLMDAALDRYEAIARTMKFARPRVAVVSNVTGELATGDELGSAAYWRRHLRETVRFAKSVEALRATGASVAIELGPHPTLLGLLAENLGETDGLSAPSLRRGRSDREQILESAGALHVHGVAIDWRAVHRDTGARRIRLPTYPFRRERHWLERDDEVEISETATVRSNGDSRSLRKTASPLLPPAVKNLGDPLVPATPAARQQDLSAMIRGHVARATGRSAAEIAAEVPLTEQGLDSLMMLQLRNQLAKSLGVPLPTLAFAQHRTVHTLSAHLESLLPLRASGVGARLDGEPSSPQNVEILAGDESLTPLTMIHGLGGHGWPYVTLREALGMRPLVVVNKVSMRRTLREYAAALAETIRRRPGPYVLGGWSFGGLLAHETAHQLQRLGERVLGVFLFDTYLPDTSAGHGMRRLVRKALSMLGEGSPSATRPLRAAVQRRLLQLHPMERLLLSLHRTDEITRGADIHRLAEIVIPGSQPPPGHQEATLDDAARWLLGELDQEARRGLMLPESTVESIAALRDMKDFCAMAREYEPPRSQVQGFQINVAGNRRARAWGRYFHKPVRCFEFDLQAQTPRRSGMFGVYPDFEAHVAQFDAANVEVFAPTVASLLSELDRAAPRTRAP